MIVYFSLTGNTRRFVNKLDIKFQTVEENVCVPYLLFVPTYSRIAKPVVDFINQENNRRFLRGVVGFGNRNFFNRFGIAGDIISKKCEVPLLRKIEQDGSPRDVNIIQEGFDLWCR